MLLRFCYCVYATAIKPQDVIDTATEDDDMLLFHLQALQAPEVSPWKLPFIRLYSTHELVRQSGERVPRLRVRYFIYFTRLVFELISDPAIKFVVDHLREMPCEVIPTTPERLAVQECRRQPMFSSASGSAQLEKNPAQRFSLAGVMKRVESAGYPLLQHQPTGLKPTLYVYQRSTVQWMLDQEADETTGKPPSRN